MLATSPEDAARGIETLLTPTDAAVLRGELAEYLVSSAQDGLAPGSQGWWDDNCLVRPWGFDLSGIAVPGPAAAWPAGHVRAAAATANGWPRTIPGVEARLFDHDGHLTLMQNRVPEVHAWLSEHLLAALVRTYDHGARRGGITSGLALIGTTCCVLVAGMCCPGDVTNESDESDNEFNALPADWESNHDLLARPPDGG